MYPVVVTGSQSGMGLAIRQQLEHNGYTVIGVDLPGKGAEIESDLSTSDGQCSATERILALTPMISGAVCNAGVDTANIPLVLGLNYFGAVNILLTLREALQRAGESAAVITVSNSIFISPQIPQAPVEALLAGNAKQAENDLRATPSYAYAVSKFALARWIRKHAASPEWAGAKIRLNGICPGPVMTPLLEKDLQDPIKGPAIRALPRPVGEFATPDQVAQLVDFLISDRARFIVGQLIAIDGGLEASFRPTDWPTPWNIPSESFKKLIKL
jgi:NAD(P)-dependent dehydrogenase (short-subunit alcohol dehydrogenase family)